MALAARSRDQLEAVAEEVRKRGRRALVVECNAAVTANLESFVARAMEEFGRIDIVINNVGGSMPKGFLQTTEKEFESAFHFNVTTAFALSKAAVPHMRQRGGGAIVNVASLGGLRPWRAHLPYCVSKAALVMATQCLALSLAPEIRVNAVAPGILDEPGADDKLEQRIPARRFGTQKEAVEAVLFLLAGGTYTTGEVLRVDGGRGLA